MNEVKHVLKDIAWKTHREYWKEEARGCPDLEVLVKLRVKN